MLVAHLDTVHKKLPSFICYSKDGNYMMSPDGIGGDDRCGVYIILSLLNKLPFKPHVVFTMDEEIGGKGAYAFVSYADKHPIEQLKYIVEFDRKGNNDCVFYSCGNDSFVEFVEQFGFKKSYGTFSDISIIAPALGAAAVNLSSGYYNPHTEHEYVSVKDMNKIIDASVKMLTTKCESFEYVDAPKYSYIEYKGYVEVCFLPKDKVYVYSYIAKGYVPNSDYDVAIDKNGKYYKLTSYGDLISINTLNFIDQDFKPKFIPEHACSFPLFC